MSSGHSLTQLSPAGGAILVTKFQRGTSLTDSSG
jgi:hypothetical protein